MTTTSTKVSVPLGRRDKEYYRLDVSNNLPPGTDIVEELERRPRLPRSPALPRRSLPELPPRSERRGKWISKYLDMLDPETEYDQIVRVCNFYSGSDFNTALGYACVFVWLTSTPAGANAIHGGKVIRRGHQRYYETQYFNLQWVYWGSGAKQTREYAEKINKIHAGVWKRAPGTFHFAWEAQAAIILLSWYENYIRTVVGAKKQIHPQLKKAWPEWGERLTSRLVPESGSVVPNFGINYPRNWGEIDAFANWFTNFDFDQQRTEEDTIKGHETAEAFIHQFSELWLPRPLHFLGRNIILTFLPPAIRQKQRLEDPNPILQWLVKAFFRTAINRSDSRPDPVDAPLEAFFDDLKSWDLSKIDKVEAARRDRESRWIKVSACAFVVLCALYRIVLL
ncbi:hypothetical protein BS50DRAFT_588230 [Corynespora cassiicola Philippines]|uniref:ER-bound oxygenase mpaB/mpaB'/Rubber oxygenase catalytic domain-containing protein n=1 Tax=Corynespora cassiicola Philippines TaxID=1448308 RepID=A0A2T2NPA5_CORCC|nr:hypothetical protein BS50DRAFT_588230 [Corynespora cassiicola Philippines]